MATVYKAGTQHTGQLSTARNVRPNRSIHQVKPGESLSDIASMYQLTPDEIIQLNSHTLGATNVPHAGMRLQV